MVENPLNIDLYGVFVVVKDSWCIPLSDSIAFLLTSFSKTSKVARPFS
jgi:hypothetical protein